MKQPLLFLCHRIPYPPNKGDKIRSFHLLRYLSDIFDIYLATFVDSSEDWQWVPEVEKLCAGSIFLPLNPSAAKLRSLRGLLSEQPLSVPYYSNAEMCAWVENKVKEYAINHALVFSSAMAQYVLDPAIGLQRRVIDFVDIDSDKWQQYAALKPWPLSWLYRREGKLLLAYDRTVAETFDASLFVSPAEAAMFRELAPETAHKTGYYSNGVNTVYFSPANAYENPYAVDENVLVFTGAMDYWPNIDAVTWFAREVFPQLREHQPQLHFYIVGSNPDRSVSQLSELPGVTVTGRVDDVRPYLQFAHAAVAPMRVARGVQNKVLEAMAMEKVVLVSSKGLEGIEAVHGEHVLVADSPAEYCLLWQKLLAGEFAPLGGRARDCITRHFSWEKNLACVARLLNEESPVEAAEVASA